MFNQSFLLWPDWKTIINEVNDVRWEVRFVGRRLPSRLASHLKTATTWLWLNNSRWLVVISWERPTQIPRQIHFSPAFTTTKQQIKHWDTQSQQTTVIWMLELNWLDYEIHLINEWITHRSPLDFSGCLFLRKIRNLFPRFSSSMSIIRFA